MNVCTLLGRSGCDAHGIWQTGEADPPKVRLGRKLLDKPGGCCCPSSLGAMATFRLVLLRKKFGFKTVIRC